MAIRFSVPFWGCCRWNVWVDYVTQGSPSCWSRAVWDCSAVVCRCGPNVTGQRSCIWDRRARQHQSRRTRECHTRTLLSFRLDIQILAYIDTALSTEYLVSKHQPYHPSYQPINMYFAKLISFFALATTSLGGVIQSRHWGPAEYYALGCPRNTTKPYASQHEQTKVLSTFANEVFVHQEVALGYDTYAAVNFINHAPEVSGVSLSPFSSSRYDLPSAQNFPNRSRVACPLHRFFTKWRPLNPTSTPPL